MTSFIDPTFPVAVSPTTQSVRDNFQHAHDEITALQSGTLLLSGGTMTGNLIMGTGTTFTLAADAVSNFQAVTLQQLNSRTAQYLPLAGGQMSGNLTMGTGTTFSMPINGKANLTGTTTVGNMTAPAAAAAGQLFGTYATMGSLSINTYLDTTGASWRHSNTYIPATINSDTGGLRFNVAATGAADSVASGFVAGLSIDASGNVFGYNNVSASGYLICGTSGSFYLGDSGGYRVLGFASGYALQYRISDGQIIYQTPIAPAWQCDRAGNFQAFAQLLAPKITMSGGAFAGFPSIYPASGTTIFAYNSSFYWNWNTSSGDMSWVTTVSGNFTMTGTGNWFVPQAAYKPGGGMWADSSDARIKRNVEDYTAGLAEVMQLRPVTYEHNGLGGTRDTGIRYHGLVAQEAQTIMPEMVGSQKVKLHVEDANEIDLLTMNATPLIYALVNAVKELRTELETMKASLAGA